MTDNFKIGDKVKVLRGYDPFVRGEIGIVVDVSCLIAKVKQLTSIAEIWLNCFDLELYHSPSGETSMKPSTKFNIGDEVEIMADDYTNFSKGDKATIILVHDCEGYNIQVRKLGVKPYQTWIRHTEIRLVKAKDRQTEKKDYFAFKKGDLVQVVNYSDSRVKEREVLRVNVDSDSLRTFIGVNYFGELDETYIIHKDNVRLCNDRNTIVYKKGDKIQIQPCRSGARSWSKGNKTLTLPEGKIGLVLENSNDIMSGINIESSDREWLHLTINKNTILPFRYRIDDLVTLDYDWLCSNCLKSSRLDRAKVVTDLGENILVSVDCQVSNCKFNSHLTLRYDKISPFTESTSTEVVVEDPVKVPVQKTYPAFVAGDRVQVIAMNPFMPPVEIGTLLMVDEDSPTTEYKTIVKGLGSSDTPYFLEKDYLKICNDPAEIEYQVGDKAQIQKCEKAARSYPGISPPLVLMPGQVVTVTSKEGEYSKGYLDFRHPNINMELNISKKHVLPYKYQPDQLVFIVSSVGCNSCRSKSVKVLQDMGKNILLDMNCKVCGFGQLTVQSFEIQPYIEKVTEEVVDVPKVETVPASVPEFKIGDRVQVIGSSIIPYRDLMVVTELPNKNYSEIHLLKYAGNNTSAYSIHSQYMHLCNNPKKIIYKKGDKAQMCRYGEMFISNEVTLKEGEILSVYEDSLEGDVVVKLVNPAGGYPFVYLNKTCVLPYKEPIPETIKVVHDKPPEITQVIPTAAITEIPVKKKSIRWEYRLVNESSIYYAQIEINKLTREGWIVEKIDDDLHKAVLRRPFLKFSSKKA